MRVICAFSIGLLTWFYAGNCWLVAEHLSIGQGQLGAELSWIPVSDAEDSFYMAQWTRDDRLLLTPNEVFFPKLGLRATGTGNVPDIDKLNGGNSFANIEEWDSGDVAQWGVYFQRTGEIKVRVCMSGVKPGNPFLLKLGESSSPISIDPIVEDPADGNAQCVATISMVVTEPGMQILNLTSQSVDANATLHWIEVSGAAVRGAAVLRKRWRPAAAHTKFTSSTVTGDVRMWVMELDAVPGDLGFYCPITTPFGYYGPTWNADGTVGSGFNFSLWSFGRDQAEPPVNQLAHLLAIGNRQATFGQFNHEGTGVKVRDWQPLAGRQGGRQTIALRVEPGPTHDTYFSYFYAADEKCWRLFAVGNDYNRGKPIRSLWVGSFVEVPGPPPVQRTGPYERTMRYRGWVMDAAGTWHRLDQMVNGNVDRESGLTHTARGVTEDGWFYLRTGGWTFRKASTDQVLKLKTQQQSQHPDYLSRQDVAFLTSVPSAITASIGRRTRDHVDGKYYIQNLGDDATVTIFWGASEGLTFAERWENQLTIDSPQEGENDFVIETPSQSNPVSIRMLLRNSEGQFWTTNTLQTAP
jgi:hypothetical protein